MVAQHSNVVNATELFPSKCLILSYVNFTLKKVLKVLRKKKKCRLLPAFLFNKFLSGGIHCGVRCESAILPLWPQSPCTCHVPEEKQVKRDTL